MNLRQLHTLSAILKLGSFTAAGEYVNLSHSAVSIQMKQLENDLGAALFDRHTRPTGLTVMGEKVALLAQEVIDSVDKIRDTASGEALVGSISIGIVPTTSDTLLPLILDGLRSRFPKLQVKVKSDTSAELADLTTRQELDFSILTAPTLAVPGLTITEIAAEPLYAVGPEKFKHLKSDIELLQSGPFIALNKKNWLGQQISARLQSRSIHVGETIEINSIGLIENLVVNGIGTSIIPQRHLAPPLSENMARIPFCKPTATRMLAVLKPDHNRNREIAVAIEEILAATS